MIARPQTLPRTLALIILLSMVLSACQTETIEVTRIKIMERRVIEKVLVTVEVTRIREVVVTPSPTLVPDGPFGDDPNLAPSPSPSATPAQPAVGPAPAATAPPDAAVVGERLLTAVRDMEQTFLALVQALNSDPLSGAYVIELYAAIRAAPTFAIPEDEAALQSFYTRYREQVDYALVQATDLHNHLVQIEAGEAAQTQVSPTHLSLARDAASAGTSALQGLIRDLENYLASLP